MKCLHCGKEFEPKTYNHVFCLRKCKDQHAFQRKQNNELSKEQKKIEKKKQAQKNFLKQFGLDKKIVNVPVRRQITNE